MLEDLKKAIESGEVLEVWYFGGSNPGKIRKISPIKIDGNRVTAHCFQDDTVKTFSIDKLELSIPGKEPIGKSQIRVPQADVSSLKEIFDASKEVLEEQGWKVQCTENEISLHETFKNGKIKKNPKIRLVFEEFDYFLPKNGNESSDFDLNDYIPRIISADELENAEKVRKARPWGLSAATKNSVSYGSIKSAYSRFIEWSQELAPNKI